MQNVKQPVHEQNFLREFHSNYKLNIFDIAHFYFLCVSQKGAKLGLIKTVRANKAQFAINWIDANDWSIFVYVL